MSWWTRFGNVFRAGHVERELDAELQFHLEERIRELTAQGLTRGAAAAQVARRFGNRQRWRDQSRDVKLLSWLDSLVRDLRVGVRMLRNNGVVTLAAVVSLSLALGACLAAFSLVDALILRPLPVRQPDRLVYLAFPTYTPERPEADTFNDPVFVQLREAGREHVDLFAMSTQVMRPIIFADSGGDKEPLRTQFVSGSAFGTLGVTPTVGRLLTTADDLRPGAHPVAVVSHAFWVRRFGGDPSAVGRWFTLQDQPFQIVGIADPRFPGIEPGRPTDVWLPYAMYDKRAFGNFNFNWFRVLGRIRDDVRTESAQSVLHAAFTTLRRERVQRLGSDGSPESLARFLNAPLYLHSAANGPSPVRREFERSLWILAAIAGLVLLIAGSNVANLFLARTAAREGEMALRLSIGAGRRQLIQQLLLESAIVAAAACLIGLVFAAAAGPAVVAMLAPPDDPVRLDLRYDWRLFAFSGGLALLTAALFGILPALRASAVSPLSALKYGGRSGIRAGLMRPFVVMQVAFGLVVLFVGGLLVLSFVRVSSVRPGFATSDVLLLSLDVPQRVDAGQQRAALLQVLDRLGRVPSVLAVSSAEFNVIGRAWTNNIRKPASQMETIETTIAPVTAGFFETMNIAVLAGRPFVARDLDPSQAAPVIVNHAFAAQYFGGDPAVGRLLDARFGERDAVKGGHEVVGVVADARFDLRKPAAPTVYIPLRPQSHGTIHVRIAGDPAAIGARLREEVRAASPLFRVTTIRSQASVVDETLLRERLLASLSGFFALVGLVLAAVGLYGVLSFSVVQRTREIGIRVALGARQVGVVRTVLADVGGSTLLGMACGLAGGVYLSTFVQALLFEVRPMEFWSLALPLGALMATATIAATLPALRAVRVDPAIALRYE